MLRVDATGPDTVNVMEATDFYAGADPGIVPLYSFSEAARIVRLPETTVRYWLKGGVVTSNRPSGRFDQVLQADVVHGVSFVNLLELQILKVLRREHGIPVESIRQAQRFASREMGLEHPLLSELLVGGRDIFVREVGRLVSLTRSGRFAISALLEGLLTRVEFGEARRPTRYFPLVPNTHERRSVQLAPTVRFGAPTIADTGIATLVVASRVDEGEAVADVARDYGLAERIVLDALIFEARRAA